MKIIHKDRLPLKYLKSICRINASVWYNGCPNRTKFIYWLDVLAGATSQNKWAHNYLDLALDDKGICIGYLMAYVSSKPRIFHPVMALINFLACFLLFFSKDGRGLLALHRMFRFHQDATVRLGKAALLGKDYKKISEGILVAIYPKYHKFGIYREMTKRLMEKIKGYFIFHTSTECVYQAHKAIGYKKIFECPYFYPEKHTSFIMYGEKSSLKLEFTYPSELTPWRADWKMAAILHLSQMPIIKHGSGTTQGAFGSI